MKKTKLYNNVKLTSRDIVETRELLDKQIPKRKWSRNYLQLSIQTSEIEGWQFDTEEEFLSAYSGEIVEATFYYRNEERSIYLRYDHRNTSVSVQGTSRAEIEKVFLKLDQAAISVIRSAEETVKTDGRSTFSVKKKIPACHVDKKLVEALEDFLLEELPNIANVDPTAIKGSYRVVISTPAGTEKFRSIRQYVLDRFPDFVYHIQLRIDFNFSNLFFDIDIDLNEDKDYSSVHIQCNSQNPREKALGVVEGLMRRIEPHRTTNGLFHPPLLTLITFQTASFGLPLFAGLALLGKQPSVALVLLLIWIPFVCYTFIGRNWNPYTSFDSQVQNRHTAWWRWFIYGLLGFVLFSSILAVVRQRIFGF